MQATLAVTVPFFALVLLGYVAARRELLPDAAVPGLNAYVLYFALPCMLFRFGSSLPIRQLIDPLLIAIWAVSALCVIALTIVLTLRRAGRPGGVGMTDAAFGALVAAFPNSGFMGVPLLLELLGAYAAGPVISTLLIDLVLTSTVCLALAQARVHGGHMETSLLHSAARALRGAAANPLPYAIALGAVAAATGQRLVGPVERVVFMLADSATPVALFTIGAVLWRAGRHAHTRTPPRHYLPVALIKLFVHPLVVFVVGHIAVATGAPVSRSGMTALVLAAALPSASNVSLLAERYGADNGRVARIIMASTVLAFGSFSLLAWLLGSGVLRR
ncbi:AEC family transporter [Piscinibacter koreensis]|uniref:AEC family transporter n=1 Tax=Piscinibacter koreensis TaxID=2742824 RepID=A0A7Y6TUR9_9BURK|nr:AEC family transporter [Schlegelella koreensis]NUZ04161.1 AEC family transporter [Schlegelella koreensis]